jgi:hypothetical protein
MSQELGETKQAMMQADEKEVEAILNRRPHGHYWIVIHHKPTKARLDTGELVIIRVVKDYDTKPKPLVGTIILEVLDGEIVKHEVSPHDAPIDWGTIEKQAGLVDYSTGFENHRAAKAYVYN